MIQQHSAQTGAALKSHAQGIATLTEAMKQMAAQHQQLAANVANLALAHHKSHGELLDALTAEKEVVRDKDGKAAGVRVKRKEVMQ
jgi:phage-related minor tail protein